MQKNFADIMHRNVQKNSKFEKTDKPAGKMKRTLQLNCRNSAENYYGLEIT